MDVHASASGVSETGRRKENQDSVLVHMPPRGAWLMAVADGMGGHAAGAYASQRTLEVVQSAISGGEGISTAVQRANEVLNDEAKRPGFRGMGTTLVGLVAADDSFTVFNVGDSRAYRITEESIQKITDDHSFVAEAVRSGTMTEEAAVASEWGNMITRSLGTGDAVDVDVFGPFTPTASEIILLCSDGLYKSVPDRLILDVVRGTANLEEASQALVNVAFRRGSDDNISVVLLEFGSMSRSSGDLMELPPSIVQQRENSLSLPVGRTPVAAGEPPGAENPRLPQPVGLSKGRSGTTHHRRRVALLVAMTGLLGAGIALGVSRPTDPPPSSLHQAATEPEEEEAGFLDAGRASDGSAIDSEDVDSVRGDEPYPDQGQTGEPENPAPTDQRGGE